MRRYSVQLSVCFAAIVLAVALRAGPLDPPAGPITPTYKTLAEVEPRIAINAANTPGDSDSVFKITQPGSYYLTGNMTGQPAKRGIEISTFGGAGSVTLDLMGFEVRGVSGSLDGIVATNVLGQRCVVRNGTVRNWGENGVAIFSAETVVEDLIVRVNAEAGIIASSWSRILNCTVTENGANGIDGASIQAVGCTVTKNGGVGIQSGGGVGSGTVVSGCIVLDNIGDGIANSSGSGVLVTGCTVVTNGGDGINVGFECIVSGCIVRENAGDGIQVVTDCIVQGNTCTGNGAGASDGAGIHAQSNDNRIEGNNVVGNDRGIDVDIAGNFIARNTCSGNTTNWDIVAGNVCLVVQGVTGAAILGNSGGAAPGSTDPNANFSY